MGKYALGFLALAAGIGAFLWSRSEVARESGALETEIDQARQEGLPIDVADLRARLADRTGANAGPLYLRAFETIGRIRQGGVLREADRHLMSGQLTREEEDELRTVLLDVAPALELVEQGSRLPRLDYGRKWEAGAELLLPDIAQMRDANRLLRARALLEARDGDHARAFETLKASARANAHTGQDPVLISALARISTDTRTVETAWHLVQQRPNDPESIRGAREVLEAMGPVTDLRWHLQSEALYPRMLSRMLASSSPDQVMKMMTGADHGGAGWELRLLALPTVRRANEAVAIRFWRDYFRALPSDTNQLLSAGPKLAAVEQAYGGRPGISSAMTRILTPVLSQSVDHVGVQLTQRRLLATCLGLVDAKRRTGAFPRELPELGLWTIDPFSDKPLVYRTTPRGFTLYSLGPNRKDDGGKPRSTSRTEAGYDLVLEYPTPPAPPRVPTRPRVPGNPARSGPPAL